MHRSRFSHCSVYEVAPFVVISIETGLLARAEGTETVAAFSAIQSLSQFAVGLFNFLLLVVMNHVSKSIGAKAWTQVASRVRLAVFSALISGLACALLLLSLKAPIFSLLQLEPSVTRIARPYYTLRSLTVPSLLVIKVGIGALCGLQRLGIMTMVSVLSSASEVLLVYWSIHHAGFGGGLEGLAWCALLNSSFWGLVALCLVFALLPKKKSRTITDPILESDLDTVLEEGKEIEAPSVGCCTFLQNSLDTILRSLFLQALTNHIKPNCYHRSLYPTNI